MPRVVRLEELDGALSIYFTLWYSVYATVWYLPLARGSSPERESGIVQTTLLFRQAPSVCCPF